MIPKAPLYCRGVEWAAAGHSLLGFQLRTSLPKADDVERLKMAGTTGHVPALGSS
jgi:hypothetical protein